MVYCIVADMSKEINILSEQCFFFLLWLKVIFTAAGVPVERSCVTLKKMKQILLRILVRGAKPYEESMKEKPERRLNSYSVAHRVWRSSEGAA